MVGMSRPQKRTFNRPQKQTGQRRKVSKKLAPAKTLSGISAFQDAQGKVAVWPSDRRLDAQTAVLEHLAGWAPRSWGVNHALTVRAQREFGLDDAKYGRSRA